MKLRKETTIVLVLVTIALTPVLSAPFPYGRMRSPKEKASPEEHEDDDTEAPVTTTTTTTEAPEPGTGCYIDGRHFREGAQIPSDSTKPCEVCYCIRNTSACVLQECTLQVGGCAPHYTSNSCCPTSYNCSTEAATTVPPELRHPSVPEGGCTAQGRDYQDGEAVPSTDKCEHCYCMKNEVVCAVQECKPPCDGCVPIPSDNDQCCPERYECAAPTKTVPSSKVVFGNHSASATSTTSTTTSKSITVTELSASSEAPEVTTSAIKDLKSSATKTEKPEAMNSDALAKDDESPTGSSLTVNESDSMASTVSDSSTKESFTSMTPSSTPSSPLTTQRAPLPDKDVTTGEAITVSSTTSSPGITSDKKEEKDHSEITENSTPSIASGSSDSSVELTSSLPGKEQVESTVSPLKSEQSNDDGFLSTVSSIISSLFGQRDETTTAEPAIDVQSRQQTKSPIAVDHTASSTTTSSSVVSSESNRQTTVRDEVTTEYHELITDHVTGSSSSPSTKEQIISTTVEPVRTSEPSSSSISDLILNEVDNGRLEPMMADSNVGDMTESPVRKMETPGQLRKDDYLKPTNSSRRRFPSPGVIPGEGICRHEGKVYQNGDEVSSKNPCVEYCICMNSVVYCDETVCDDHTPPNQNCTKIEVPNECCPKLDCRPFVNELQSSDATTENVKTISTRPEEPTPDVSVISSSTTESAIPQLIETTTADYGELNSGSVTTSKPMDTDFTQKDISAQPDEQTTPVPMVSSSTIESVPVDIETASTTTAKPDGEELVQKDISSQPDEPTTPVPAVSSTIESVLSTVSASTSSGESSKEPSVQPDEPTSPAFSSSTVEPISSSASTDSPISSTSVRPPMIQLETETTKPGSDELIAETTTFSYGERDLDVVSTIPPVSPDTAQAEQTSSASPLVTSPGSESVNIVGPMNETVSASSKPPSVVPLEAETTTSRFEIPDSEYVTTSEPDGEVLEKKDHSSPSDALTTVASDSNTVEPAVPQVSTVPPPKSSSETPSVVPLIESTTSNDEELISGSVTTSEPMVRDFTQENITAQSEEMTTAVPIVSSSTIESVPVDVEIASTTTENPDGDVVQKDISAQPEDPTTPVPTVASSTIESVLSTVSASTSKGESSKEPSVFPPEPETTTSSENKSELDPVTTLDSNDGIINKETTSFQPDAPTTPVRFIISSTVSSVSDLSPTSDSSEETTVIPVDIETASTTTAEPDGDLVQKDISAQPDDPTSPAPTFSSSTVEPISSSASTDSPDSPTSVKPPIIQPEIKTTTPNSDEFIAETTTFSYEEKDSDVVSTLRPESPDTEQDEQTSSVSPLVTSPRVESVDPMDKTVSTSKAPPVVPLAAETTTSHFEIPDSEYVTTSEPDGEVLEKKDHSSPFDAITTVASDSTTVEPAVPQVSTVPPPKSSSETPSVVPLIESTTSNDEELNSGSVTTSEPLDRDFTQKDISSQPDESTTPVSIGSSSTIESILSSVSTFSTVTENREELDEPTTPASVPSSSTTESVLSSSTTVGSIASVSASTGVASEEPSAFPLERETTPSAENRNELDTVTTSEPDESLDKETTSFKPDAPTTPVRVDIASTEEPTASSVSEFSSTGDSSVEPTAIPVDMETASFTTSEPDGDDLAQKDISAQPAETTTPALTHSSSTVEPISSSASTDSPISSTSVEHPILPLENKTTTPSNDEVIAGTTTFSYEETDSDVVSTLRPVLPDTTQADQTSSVSPLVTSPGSESVDIVIPMNKTVNASSKAPPVFPLEAETTTSRFEIPDSDYVTTSEPDSELLKKDDHSSSSDALTTVTLDSTTEEPVVSRVSTVPSPRSSSETPSVVPVKIETTTSSEEELNSGSVTTSESIDRDFTKEDITALPEEMTTAVPIVSSSTVGSVSSPVSTISTVTENREELDDPTTPASVPSSSTVDSVRSTVSVRASTGAASEELSVFPLETTSFKPDAPTTPVRVDIASTEEPTASNVSDLKPASDSSVEPTVIPVDMETASFTTSEPDGDDLVQKDISAQPAETTTPAPTFSSTAEPAASSASTDSPASPASVKPPIIQPEIKTTTPNSDEFIAETTTFSYEEKDSDVVSTLRPESPDTEQTEQTSSVSPLVTSPRVESVDPMDKTVSTSKAPPVVPLEAETTTSRFEIPDSEYVTTSEPDSEVLEKKDHSSPSDALTTVASDSTTVESAVPQVSTVLPPKSSSETPSVVQLIETTTSNGKELSSGSVTTSEPLDGDFTQENITAQPEEMTTAVPIVSSSTVGSVLSPVSTISTITENRGELDDSTTLVSVLSSSTVESVVSTVFSSSSTGAASKEPSVFPEVEKTTTSSNGRQDPEFVTTSEPDLDDLVQKDISSQPDDATTPVSADYSSTLEPIASQVSTTTTSSTASEKPSVFPVELATMTSRNDELNLETVTTVQPEQENLFQNNSSSTEPTVSNVTVSEEKSTVTTVTSVPTIETRGVEPSRPAVLPRSETQSVTEDMIKEMLATSTVSSVTPSDKYEGDDELEEGTCIFDGKAYQSAEQIPRPHPCDFCFCFRGDIICLQQTCPPPIKGCFETPIQGFCCPRYECPVQSGSQNVTTPRSVDEAKGCEIDGDFYRVGQTIKQSSGPCLNCKCGDTGIMQCNPQSCFPQPPLLLRMNREFFTSRR
ncbi:hypothetical protein HDE_07113 [Halotydeus destructor]|nr:hypothetical protein HDE_07113 [Halotydeus destructor]